MLLFFLLLQGVSAPRSFEDALESFAKGDETARADLVEAGTASIPPLRRIRERSPARIDALVYDLKKAAAGPDAKPLIDLLEGKQTLDAGPIGFFAALDALAKDLPLLLDPSLYGTQDQRAAVFHLKERPRRELLDSFCSQMGLDYGFFYGTVLVGAPARLWPTRPPLPRAPLVPEESARAARLIARLASDRAEDRDQSQALLLNLGKGAIPLLEKGAKGTDGEQRARCRELIRQLEAPPPEAAFHTPAAALQKLVGADLALRKSLEEMRVSFKVSEIVLDGALRLMLLPRELPIELAPSLREARLTLDLQDRSLWSVLCLATHACGFDFAILAGKLVIDRKDAIERRLRSGR